MLQVIVAKIDFVTLSLENQIWLLFQFSNKIEGFLNVNDSISLDVLLLSN